MTKISISVIEFDIITFKSLGDKALSVFLPVASYKRTQPMQTRVAPDSQRLSLGSFACVPVNKFDVAQ